MDVSISRLNKEQKEQFLACFNTAYLIAKMELSFLLYPKLLDLQEKYGVKLPNSYHTDQASRRFMGYIHDDMKQQTHASLHNSRVLSIMFDGATDVSPSEKEIVYV